MTTRPLILPLVISAALHTAVLLGVLLTCTGKTGFNQDIPVLLVSFESPGASAMISKASGVHFGSEHQSITENLKSETRSSHYSDRHELMKEVRLEEDTRDVTEHQGMPDSGAIKESAEGHHDGPSQAGENGVGSGNVGTGKSNSATISVLSKPEYPRYSRIHGEEGTVVLEVEVTAEGRPGKVSVIHSSGYQRLDDAALNALEKAEFIPARTLGKPVISTKRIAIRFNIKEWED